MQIKSPVVCRVASPNFNSTLQLHPLPLPTTKMSTTNPPSSLDFFRLRWQLQSPNPTESITILQDAQDANSTQEPYSSTHPISQAPLTNPPVPSITISLEALDEYAAKWIWVHGQHAQQNPAASPSPDHNTNRTSHFDSQGTLSYCCSEPRPGPSPRIEIIATQPGGFVTIGEFIDVVHPWVRGLDGALRTAMGVYASCPLDPGVGMCVCPTSLTGGRVRVLDHLGMTERMWADIWFLVARAAEPAAAAAAGLMGV